MAPLCAGSRSTDPAFFYPCGTRKLPFCTTTLSFHQTLSLQAVFCFLLFSYSSLRVGFVLDTLSVARVTIHAFCLCLLIKRAPFLGTILFPTRSILPFPGSLRLCQFGAIPRPPTLARGPFLPTEVRCPSPSLMSNSSLLIQSKFFVLLLKTPDLLFFAWPLVFSL